MSVSDYKAQIAALQQQLASLSHNDQHDQPDYEEYDEPPKQQKKPRVIKEPKLTVPRVNYRNLTPEQKSQIRTAWINTPGKASTKGQVLAQQLPYTEYMIRKVVSTQD